MTSNFKKGGIDLEEILFALKNMPEKYQVSRQSIIDFIGRNLGFDYDRNQSIKNILEAETIEEFSVSSFDEHETLDIFLRNNRPPISEGHPEGDDIVFGNLDDLATVTNLFGIVDDLSTVTTFKHNQVIDNIISSLFENDGLTDGNYLFLYNAFQQMRGEDVDDFI